MRTRGEVKNYEKSYYFGENDFFYIYGIDGSVKNKRLICVIEFDEKKFLWSLPVDLVIEALKENNLIKA